MNTSFSSTMILINIKLHFESCWIMRIPCMFVCLFVFRIFHLILNFIYKKKIYVYKLHSIHFVSLSLSLFECETSFKIYTINMSLCENTRWSSAKLSDAIMTWVFFHIYPRNSHFKQKYILRICFYKYFLIYWNIFHRTTDCFTYCLEKQVVLKCFCFSKKKKKNS